MAAFPDDLRMNSSCICKFAGLRI